MNKKHSKIILGTNNPYKKEKLKWVVDGFFSVAEEMREDMDTEETGKTFEENACLKALEAARKENSYAIASDGGILIPALGNNWNELLTKRFSGLENAGDFDRMNVLLELMKGKTGKDRTIVWKEAIAIAGPGGVIFSCEADGDTGILQESYDPAQYKEGIWLCTLTSYPQFGGRNFFELSEEERKYGEISWWKLKEKTRDYLALMKKKHENINVRKSVRIIIKNEKKQYLVMEKPDGGLGFAGGGVEAGETFEQAIDRECCEEIGVSIKEMFDFAFIGWVYRKIKIDYYFDECVYTATIRGDGMKKIKLSPEHESIYWYSLNEMPFSVKDELIRYLNLKK